MVRRQPTVELLLLGDELLDSGVPGPGLVRDALGPLLPPWLAAAAPSRSACAGSATTGTCCGRPCGTRPPTWW
ncbi:hypothetical protein ACFQ1I_23525 [Kitasatospora arboriphila]